MILPEGVFPVVSGPDDLDRPFWDGTREEQLLIQRCRECRGWQWGPELICRHCHSFEVGFEEVAPTGTIYSWERVWHPIVPQLADAVPFVIVIVSLTDAPQIRLVGNLAADPLEPVVIGTAVEAVFEHHPDYTLVQWAKRS